MQIISKKNFFSIVCKVYTVMSLAKILYEIVLGKKDPYYVENFITMFFLSLVATLVLSLHYYLQNVPLIIVFLGQYLLLIGIVMLSIWVEDHFQELAPTAYRDMFLSFTIPYIILAIMYYAVYLIQLRRANKTLAEIRKDGRNKDEH
jgi:hypothetical protein